MKRKMLFLNFITVLMSALFMLSACAGPVPVGTIEGKPSYWTGEDGIYVGVRQNLSAYGKHNQDYSMMFFSPHFYVDEDRTTEVVGPASNNTWELWVPKGTTDIYVVPPHIALLDKVDEQQISLDQAYPIQAESFSIAGAFIPKLVGLEPNDNKIRLQLFLVSEGSQYPEGSNLLYDGKRYRLSRFSAKLDEEDNVVYISVSCEMPDLYTASMAMAFGSIQYSTLQTIIPANEAVYTCGEENIKIHIFTLED